MTALQISGLNKRFNDYVAVEDFTLDVEHGTLVSLLGPSGCGKSTILRMTAGLLEPDAGTITVGGTDITWRAPHKRNIGLVFQSYALFPHMSVFENVAFGLRRRRLSEHDIKARVSETLELVRMDGFDRRFPHELSGGQQQRIALARAIAPRPALLLLDEPLSNLDAKLRDTMRFELRRLQQELSITTIFVTHDQEEALTMSDRICVLSHGVLQQIGTPREVYDHPRTPFVAEFFGRSNAFYGELVAVNGSGGRILLADGPELVATHVPAGLSIGDRVRVTIRQESITIAGEGHQVNRFAGTLALASFAGSAVQFMVRLKDGVELIAEMRAGRGQDLPETGRAVEIAVPADDIIVMTA